MKQTAGSKQNQRSAINLALLRVDFEKIGTKVRWVPPTRMPVDIMTMSDGSTGNAVLSAWEQQGRLSERASEDLE